MTILKITLLGSFCLSSAALAQVPPGTPAPVAPVKEKKICRSEVPVGSIMAKRTCLTKAQWAALDGRRGEQAEKAIDYVRERASAGLSAVQ